MIRTKTKKQHKGPVQLDLFEPYAYGFEFKVIVTNRQFGAAGVVGFHERRGSQAGVVMGLRISRNATPDRVSTGWVPHPPP